MPCEWTNTCQTTGIILKEPEITNKEVRFIFDMKGQRINTITVPGTYIKLYTDGKNTDKFYELLCETANKNPDVFFSNLKKKMGKNMKWAYSIGSGDDKIPCYELFFEDKK